MWHARELASDIRNMFGATSQNMFGDKQALSFKQFSFHFPISDPLSHSYTFIYFFFIFHETIFSSSLPYLLSFLHSFCIPTTRPYFLFPSSLIPPLHIIASSFFSLFFIFFLPCHYTYFLPVFSSLSPSVSNFAIPSFFLPFGIHCFIISFL